ncbi:hypothetical protein LCI18_006762 [Fusarium solani-melongenae]|uniref:Uncharacterized protein n=1 Tax=Fusarium solani subsp. cucurbitae TaxID=2747967 RepID=A0ACD3Z411_FUSSC|nr:hypothetical protein LCI18_006762 [Fusarium solani-melongenae]
MSNSSSLIDMTGSPFEHLSSETIVFSLQFRRTHPSSESCVLQLEVSRVGAAPSRASPLALVLGNLPAHYVPARPPQSPSSPQFFLDLITWRIPANWILFLLAQSSSLPGDGSPLLPRHSHGNHSSAYFCSTQSHENCGIASLQVGSYDRISRYPTNATLPYFIDMNSFPTKADAEYAAKSFEQAAANWALGPVQFKRELTRRDAFFSVVYFVGTPEDRSLAKAFFPNCPAKSRLVKVYPRAFIFRDAMVNIFCHELGHVLGLRHEFAGQREAYNPSVCWGLPNPESVMNYYDHPLKMAVHELDIVLTNALYAYNGESFQGFLIDVVSPTA